MEEFSTLEEERDALWEIIEKETGVKFKDHRNAPQPQDHFSDTANKAIHRLRYVLQYIGNRDDVGKLSRMMKELNRDGELSPEMKQWWLGRY